MRPEKQFPSNTFAISVIFLVIEIYSFRCSINKSDMKYDFLNESLDLMGSNCHQVSILCGYRNYLEIENFPKELLIEINKLVHVVIIIIIIIIKMVIN